MYQNLPRAIIVDPLKGAIEKMKRIHEQDDKKKHFQQKSERNRSWIRTVTVETIQLLYYTRNFATTN